jgi:hypothetical protein
MRDGLKPGAGKGNLLCPSGYTYLFRPNRFSVDQFYHMYSWLYGGDNYERTPEGVILTSTRSGDDYWAIIVVDVDANDLLMDEDPLAGLVWEDDDDIFGKLPPKAAEEFIEFKETDLAKKGICDEFTKWGEKFISKHGLKPNEMLLTDIMREPMLTGKTNRTLKVEKIFVFDYLFEHMFEIHNIEEFNEFVKKQEIQKIADSITNE